MSSPSPSPPSSPSPAKKLSRKITTSPVPSPGTGNDQCAPSRETKFTVPPRDDPSARVISGLKTLYHTRLLKFEKEYYFSNFHYAAISDSEIESKPQVLLIGQYSTGKTSFISHLLGKPYPQAHIGPEPTTDKFIAVVHGNEEKVIKGNSLTVVPELPFGGLSNFGASFLNKFEACKITL